MTWPKNVRKSDLEISYFKGSGAGGQNRNKRDTACRIKHIPTGITVTCEEQRTQGKNKKIAFQKLAKQLIPLMKSSFEDTEKFRNEERIRTYNEPRNQVTDHRTNKKAPFDKVLNGELDLLK